MRAAVLLYAAAWSRGPGWHNPDGWSLEPGRGSTLQLDAAYGAAAEGMREGEGHQHHARLGKARGFPGYQNAYPDEPRCAPSKGVERLVRKHGLDAARAVDLGSADFDEAALRALIKVYVISLPGDGGNRTGLEAAAARLKGLGLEHSVCDGVVASPEEWTRLVDKGVVGNHAYPKAKFPQLRCGNLGCALAHRECLHTAHVDWERDGRPARFVVVLEDDEEVRPEALSDLAALLKAEEGKVDFVNLNALRTTGHAVPGVENFVRLAHDLPVRPFFHGLGGVSQDEPLCPGRAWDEVRTLSTNVWTGAYAVSPALIPGLQGVFDLYTRDFPAHGNTGVMGNVDWWLYTFLAAADPWVRSYAAFTNTLSMHVESPATKQRSGINNANLC